MAEPALVAAQARHALLALARQVVERQARGEPAPSLPRDHEDLSRLAGAFVTIERGGRLRGCIGRIVADRSLVEVVADCARAAAFDDPRFPGVEASELSELEYEISVLTPMQPAAPDEVVVGRDGLLIRHRGRSGLLLPQVAATRGWDAARFLAEVCRKAGLGPDAWRDQEARLERFQAEVFGEDSEQVRAAARGPRRG